MILFHNIRRAQPHMRLFWAFTTPLSVNCASLQHKMFQAIHWNYNYSQNTVAKLRLFSRSAGFSCCKKMILHWCHFRIDFKIFCTLDQDSQITWYRSSAWSRIFGTELSFDNSNVIYSFIWNPFSSFSSPHILISSLFMFLNIFFFSACLDIRPFRKQFKHRYLRNANEKLLSFW